MARIWNKYPYTDFHELNLSWVIDKITDFEARLTDVEEDVAELKTRMTAVEGRITAAEGTITQHTSQIGALQTDNTSNKNRLTALENADIQAASMLEGVSSVQAANTTVTVNFSAATYANGARTAGTDSATIPAATISAAGVMLPGDRQKMEKMTLSGDDIIFAGTARGDDPTNNSDFATKGYVDSLAITGSASVSLAISGTVHWMEGLTQVDYDSFKLYTYGKVAQIKTWISHTLDSERSYGTSMFTIHIPEEYAGDIYENVTCYNETDGSLVPCRLQGFANDAVGSGTVNMTLVPLVTVPANKKIVAYIGCTYLITG